jgi:bifunctional non-homologous end joining protein LigD
MRDTPVTYVAFDLLYLDGHSAMALGYADRRELLEALELDGASWRTPAYHRGEGGALLEATRELGIEGVVAKRLDSTYEPGRRSSAWLKVKNVCEQDVVIGGWTPGEGGRSSTLGALACGVYADDRLTYVGKVGSGFTERTLALVQRELEPLRRGDSPFDGRQPPKGTVFVEPRLVARVELREWTRSGTMRAPSFKGLRDDVDPHDCVREEGPSG